MRIEPDLAWHFTYNGTPDSMRAKLLAYSHTENATQDIVDTDAIEKAVANRTDIFNEAERFDEVPLGSELPRSLSNNPEKWRGNLTRAGLARRPT